MQRVSTNLTTFLKLAVPTVWIVFFTTLLIAILLVDKQTLPFLTTTSFRLGYIIVYLIFFAFLYMTVMQLKRLELGEENYLVSNYFKTYKMIYSDIESIRILPLWRFKIMTIRLKAKSSFGKKLHVLLSSHLYELFLENHPKTAEILNELTVKE